MILKARGEQLHTSEVLVPPGAGSAGVEPVSPWWSACCRAAVRSSLSGSVPPGGGCCCSVVWADTSQRDFFAGSADFAGAEWKEQQGVSYVRCVCRRPLAAVPKTHAPSLCCPLPQSGSQKLRTCPSSASAHPPDWTYHTHTHTQQLLTHTFPGQCTSAFV